METHLASVFLLLAVSKEPKLSRILLNVDKLSPVFFCLIFLFGGPEVVLVLVWWC